MRFEMGVHTLKRFHAFEKGVHILFLKRGFTFMKIILS